MKDRRISAPCASPPQCAVSTTCCMRRKATTYAEFAVHDDRAARQASAVTYTTFQARDLAATLRSCFKTRARDAYERFKPQAMIVGASCTAELIQDDPGGLAKALALPIPVIPLELPAYQKKEIGRRRNLLSPRPHLCARRSEKPARKRPSCNILGPTALGFRPPRRHARSLPSPRAARPSTSTWSRRSTRRRKS